MSPTPEPRGHIPRWHLHQVVRVLRAGGIVAYPTEAVYGLGCDPLRGEAVQRLLALKQRPMEKGLILIASDWTQLQPFLLPLTPARQQRLFATWPGPHTWVLPCRPEVPQWLRGNHDSLAVRITAHPLAAALCDAWGGALVSTSANRSGLPPARSPLRVRQQFGDEIDYLLPGALGGLATPTTIRDGVTGKILRDA
ncbi:MAG: Sua5/YciO/YrdC/YwlC family protein [Gammaproteobacteria bacterium]|nr:Sua5/YciO/YrdC/YwlC family protein [Gammaproteobacteria bacterium]